MLTLYLLKVCSFACLFRKCNNFLGFWVCRFLAKITNFDPPKKQLYNQNNINIKSCFHSSNKLRQILSCKVCISMCMLKKSNSDQSFWIIKNILDAILKALTHQSQKCFFEIYIKGHVKQVIIDIMVSLFSFLLKCNALTVNIRTVSSYCLLSAL